MNATTRTRTTVMLSVTAIAGIALGALAIWALTVAANDSGYGGSRVFLGTPVESFTITGDLTAPVTPGNSIPLDLAVSNEHERVMTVSQLSITIDEVVAPNARPDLPCSVADFTIEQAAPDFEFTVEPQATSSLSETVVKREAWPRVGMHNTSSNQDGCKGASVTLAYAASGRLEQ